MFVFAKNENIPKNISDYFEILVLLADLINYPQECLARFTRYNTVSKQQLHISKHIHDRFIARRFMMISIGIRILRGEIEEIVPCEIAEVLLNDDGVKSDI